MVSTGEGIVLALFQFDTTPVLSDYEAFVAAVYRTESSIFPIALSDLALLEAEGNLLVARVPPYYDPTQVWPVLKPKKDARNKHQYIRSVRNFVQLLDPDYINDEQSTQH